MKKLTRKIMLLTAVITCFVFAGCSVFNSKIVTADEFKSVMEKRNLKVSDMAAADINNTSAQSHLKTAYKVTESDYDLAFIELDDKTAGEDYFNSYVDNIKSNHSVGGSTNATVNDNSEWSAETDGYYYKIIRKSGTIITVSAKSDSKDTVKSIIKELGY